MKINRYRFLGLPGAVVLSIVTLCSSIGVQAAAKRTILLASGDTLQAAVDAAPAGTSFVLTPGTYRMQSVIPKDGDTFIGDGDVVLNGSEILAFTSDPEGTGLYVSSATANPPSTSAVCNAGYPLCGYTQDLFIDGVLQTPVSDPAELQVGSWYFDRTRNLVYLSVESQGHVVELGMKQYAFSGTATGVQIRNLIIEKYATPGHTGAIGGYHEGANWSIYQDEVRWNHGMGICLGPGAQVTRSFVHHNGQLGIEVVDGSNSEVSHNEISWNNYANFSTGWEAGGAKFWATTNLEVNANYVHDNNGEGLWSDTNNVGTVYEDNSVSNNVSGGISYEVSYSAIIRNNTVKGNSPNQRNWLSSAQILIQNSSNSQVYGNIIEVPSEGGNGIGVINTSRGSGVLGPWVSSNNYVHGNTVTYLGPQGSSGFADGTKATTALGNHFDQNRYILKAGGSTHWAWLGWMDWKQMRLAAQEEHGSCCN